MQVVIDELHLLLRVSDVLIRNLIWAAVAADNELRTKSSEHLTRLQERVKGCGITFRVQIIAMLINYYYLYAQVWESKTRKSEYEYTSLRGAERKKLLQRLPPHICDIVPGSNGVKITELWKVWHLNIIIIVIKIYVNSQDFWNIYEIIGTEQPMEADIENLQNKVNRLL